MHTCTLTRMYTFPHGEHSQENSQIDPEKRPLSYYQATKLTLEKKSGTPEASNLFKAKNELVTYTLKLVTETTNVPLAPDQTGPQSQKTTGSIAKSQSCQER